MKYTIGCHVLNKDGSTADGIYVFGKYGFPYISNDVSTFPEKECSIYIIDDAEYLFNQKEGILNEIFRKFEKSM